jgi:hypothetical protein
MWRIFKNLPSKRAGLTALLIIYIYTKLLYNSTKRRTFEVGGGVRLAGTALGARYLSVKPPVSKPRMIIITPAFMHVKSPVTPFIFSIQKQIPLSFQKQVPACQSAL